MTPDQITALARKYAESRYPEAKTDEDDFLYDSAVYVMEDNLRWLLRRFCLVEKSKVESVYNTTWNSWYHTLDVETKGKNQCVLDVLHFLFPDLGKEVEG